MELLHYFKGAAERVIKSHVTWADADMAFAVVRSELDTLFGQSDKSAVPVLRQASTGGQLKANDYAGHLALYVSLKEALSTAKTVENEADLDRSDLINDIIQGRLGHMSQKLFTLDAKLLRTEKRPLHFADLTDELSDWVQVLQRQKTFAPTPCIKIAATEAIIREAPTITRGPHHRQNESFSGQTRQQPLIGPIYAEYVPNSIKRKHAPF